jgi:hypothetical protein
MAVALREISVELLIQKSKLKAKLFITCDYKL